MEGACDETNEAKLEEPGTDLHTVSLMKLCMYDKQPHLNAIRKSLPSVSVCVSLLSLQGLTSLKCFHHFGARQRLDNKFPHQ
jgi:hypothetical protein